MKTNNRRAATLYYAALVFISISILLSDWTYQTASDGLYLGTFPLLYLFFAGALIVVTMVDSSCAENLQDTESISYSGIARVVLFGGAAILFAFYQESIGFIPCVVLLTAIGVIQMGERSSLVFLLFSIATALLLYAAFASFGASITAWPSVFAEDNHG